MTNIRPAISALVAVLTLASGSATARETVEEDLFRHLTYYGHALYLYETGMYRRAIIRLNSLLGALHKKNYRLPSADTILPLIESDTKCGDAFQRLRVDALELRALSQSNLSNQSAAISDLRKALALCPENARLHSTLGSIQWKIKTGRKSALGELNRAVALDPELLEAYYLRAKVFNALGERQKARADIEKAHALFSAQQKKIDELTGQVEQFVQQNKPQEALETEKRLLGLFPRDVFAIAGVARRLLDNGKPAKALELASCAVSLDPFCAYAYRTRAAIYRDLNRNDDEWSDANYAFMLEPRSLETLNTRAIANLNCDRPAEAVRDFNLLLKLQPAYADGYINRSAAYQRLGQYEEAVKDARRAILLLPKSAYGYQCLGAALRKLGQTEQARQNLELSLRYAKDATPDSIAMAKLNLAAILKDSDATLSGQYLSEAIAAVPALDSIMLKRGTFSNALGAADRALKLASQPARRSSSRQVTKLVFKKGDAQFSPAPKKSMTMRLSPIDINDSVLVSSHIIDKGGGDQASQSLYLRGIALFSLGQFAKAHEDLSRCAQQPGERQALYASILDSLCLARLNPDAVSQDSAAPDTLRFYFQKLTNAKPKSSSLSRQDEGRAHCYAGMHLSFQGSTAAKPLLLRALALLGEDSLETPLIVAELNRFPSYIRNNHKPSAKKSSTNPSPRSQQYL